MPLEIVRAMEASAKPWEVRDRMLAAIGWHPKAYVYLPASKEATDG